MTAPVRYPDGWMSRDQLAWLTKAAAGARKVVEVGVWRGRSTVALVEKCPGVVYAVDSWAITSRSYPDPEAAYKDFLHNLRGPIASGQVRVVRMDSVDAADLLLDEHGRDFDFVFIDADHSYKGVRADIVAYLPLVRPGGILAGHDFHDSLPGVEKAVRELLPAFQRGPGRIWWVRV